MLSDNSPEAQLRAENADLRARLQEAEETLHAIRSGEVDSLVVETDEGPQIFSLDAAEAASNRFRGEVLAQVSDSVIAVDPEDRVTFFNGAAERQYGVRCDEVLGRNISEIYTRHWPSPDAEAARWKALREHGEWRGETVERLRDGRQLHVESSVTMLRGADGTNAGMVAAIRDITEKNLAERRLREQEERQRFAMQAAGAGSWDWDIAAGDIIWSPENYALYDFDPAPRSPAYADWESRVHPDDLARTNALVRDVVEGNAPEFRAEFRVVHRDGRILWLQGLGRVQRDATGAAVRLSGINLDITARKRSEEEFQRLSVLLETLLHSAPIGFCFLDRELRFVHINKRLADLNGISPEAHLGWNVAQILPAFSDTLRAVTGRILATGEPVLNHEFSGETPAAPGVTRCWNESWYPVRDGAGEVLGFGAIVEEITERKRAELELKLLHETLERRIEERTAELREAYEFNHQIINSAQEGIVVCDREGRLLVWNPYMARMSRMAGEQVTGKPVTGVLPFLTQESLAQFLERALKGEVVDTPDLPYIVADTGVSGWCAARLVPLFNSQSNITGAIVTIRDTSERKHGEAMLAQASTKLRQLSVHLVQVREEEGKRIAREIHDELGGLLTAIQANVSVAIERDERGGGMAGAELMKATKLVESAADTVRRIIADLRPSVLDQLGIWAALEWHVGEIAKSAGLATEIVIDDDAAAIELDSERSTALFRIVQETLTNVVRHAAATQVAIRAWHDGDAVVVEIEDNGIGIGEAQLNKTGKWGLLGIQERVHHFGGTFRIARGSAHGTVAVVRMPLQQPSERRAAIVDDLRS